MLSLCNVQKLILEIKCQCKEHRLQSCERQELNWCLDQEPRFVLIVSRLAIHHDRGPNVHEAILALNTTSSGMKVRERFERVLAHGHPEDPNFMNFAYC